AVHVDTLELLRAHEQQAPFLSGVLSTAGGLVFAGDMDRRFHAFDAATGEELWSVRLSQAVQGMPISYAVDGRQYIAVPVGTGGGSPRGQAELLPGIRNPATGN